MTSTWIHLYLPGRPGYVLSGAVPPRPGDGAANSRIGAKAHGAFRPKVLVLDDEHIIADSIAMILNRSGFDAVAHYDGASAIEFIHRECPDILLSDVVMPHINGVQVANQARMHCPGTRIVLISGNAATPNLLEQAGPGGSPFEVLPKPIHPAHLLEILRG
jgi:CheY-like chemotaxis protein